MSGKNLLFSLLKKEIAKTLQQTIPGIPSSIENWKGQDIVFFQEDLEKKVRDHVSEKWFYSHMKGEIQKLPRIDMLNMLCRYTGFRDWNDFVMKNGSIAGNSSIPVPEKNRRWQFFLLAGLIIVFLFFFMFRPAIYKFCFVDSDNRKPIVDQPVYVELLREGESPLRVICENGCFSFRMREKKIRFVVKSPYYKEDTITRVLMNSGKDESIYLRTNDYALMIHYFSKNREADWVKRKHQLDLMFSNNAMIYQVYEDKNLGMELYNKQEFINKLTMPVKSLSDIEVIETVYSGSKISLLKFRQIERKNQVQE